MTFDEDNVKLLCYHCHLNWWHKHPLEASVWLTETIDHHRLNRLRLRSQTHFKTNLDDTELYLQQVLEKLSS